MGFLFSVFNVACWKCRYSLSPSLLAPGSLTLALDDGTTMLHPTVLSLSPSPTPHPPLDTVSDNISPDKANKQITQLTFPSTHHIPRAILRRQFPY